MKGETMRTSSGFMCSCSAKPWRKPVTFWLDSHTVSLPSSNRAVVVNSSMGLWCWVGVS